MRRVARVLTTVTVLSAAACVTADMDHRHSPVASASRVLALDFSPRAAARRSERVTQLPHAARSELARTADIAPFVATTVQHEAVRPAALGHRAETLVGHELTRRPKTPTWLLPTAKAFADDVANGIVHAAEFVFGRHRPMGEIDDRRHRVDHRDDHPEAGLWQRLRRRLWL